jgi:type II secretory pathway component PulK
MLALIAMVLVTVMLAAIVGRLSLGQRQLQLRQRQLQARCLSESAFQLALVRLQTTPAVQDVESADLERPGAYQGETWVVPADADQGRAEAVIVIEVLPSETGTSEPQDDTTRTRDVQVTTRYGAGGRGQVLHRMRRVVMMHRPSN